MDITIQNLLEDAKVFTNATERERDIIQTYLLTKLAAEPLDLPTLLARAAVFNSCSQSQLLQIQTGLLCKMAGSI